MDTKKSSLLPRSHNLALLILISLTVLSLGFLIAFLGFSLTNQ